MIGELFTYNDWRDFEITTAFNYMYKWSVLVKWNDGIWKGAMIIGQYIDQIVVELDNNEGIFSVDERKIWPYDEQLIGKRWRNYDESR